MGIKEREAAKLLFPPMPVLSADGAEPDVVSTQDTVDVLLDAAAVMRRYILAFADVSFAVQMARSFKDYLTRLFPGERRFHFFREGNVPKTKDHEHASRTAGQQAPLRKLGVDFAVAVADLPAIPQALRKEAEDLAAESGRAHTDVLLGETIARLVARGVDAVAAAMRDAEPVWQKYMIHRTMPALERLCLESALSMSGNATAQVAEDSDTLPPEGECKALPYARRLGRACIFVSNDTDIFPISLLQVPDFPDHPPVYYYDLLKSSMQKSPYMIDLVGCTRKIVQAGGPSPRAIALTWLLCGGDQTPAPGSTQLTLCRLARLGARTPQTYAKAYDLVAAAGETLEPLIDLAAAGFTHAKAAYERHEVEAHVKRALVATRYYAATSADEVPRDEVWLAHGWASMGVPEAVRDKAPSSKRARDEPGADE